MSAISVLFAAACITMVVSSLLIAIDYGTEKDEDSKRTIIWWRIFVISATVTLMSVVYQMQTLPGMKHG